MKQWENSLVDDVNRCHGGEHENQNLLFENQSR